MVWSTCSPRNSQESSPTPQFKSINSSVLSFLYSPTLTSIYDSWKNHTFHEMDFCQQSNVSVFNMLSRLVIAFLPRSKCLLISWLQSSSAVILEPPKIKSIPVSIVSPSICHEVMGPDAMILVFWMLSNISLACSYLWQFFGLEFFKILFLPLKSTWFTMFQVCSEVIQLHVCVYTFSDCFPL